MTNTVKEQVLHEYKAFFLAQPTGMTPAARIPSVQYSNKGGA